LPKVNEFYDLEGQTTKKYMEIRKTQKKVEMKFTEEIWEIET